MTLLKIWKYDGLVAGEELAERLALVLEPPLVIELNGTLGAGKTQFAKWLALALGAEPKAVTSPTFVLHHTYDTQPVVHHIDVYRLDDEDSFLELGFEELFEASAITIIEWGERFAALLPNDRLVIDIEVLDETTRSWSIRGTGERSDGMIARLT